MKRIIKASVNTTHTDSGSELVRYRIYPLYGTKEDVEEGDCLEELYDYDAATEFVGNYITQSEYLDDEDIIGIHIVACPGYGDEHEVKEYFEYVLERDLYEVVYEIFKQENSIKDVH